MRVDAFDFDLPDGRIALRPASPRESAKLLFVGPDRLSDETVGALPELLRPGDLLVFNDTKVIPAQLTGRRGQARVEVTLHQPSAADGWHVVELFTGITAIDVNGLRFDDTHLGKIQETLDQDRRVYLVFPVVESDRPSVLTPLAANLAPMRLSIIENPELGLAIVSRGIE